MVANRTTRDDRWIDDSSPRNTEEFRVLLKRHREAKRWSQERLASESEMDHSLVSRLESGQRSPTREAIGKVARGLELSIDQKDRLLIVAGYFPEDPASAMQCEPVLVKIYRLLSSEKLPEVKKEGIRKAMDAIAIAVS